MRCTTRNDGLSERLRGCLSRLVYYIPPARGCVGSWPSFKRKDRNIHLPTTSTCDRWSALLRLVPSTPLDSENSLSCSEGRLIRSGGRKGVSCLECVCMSECGMSRRTVLPGVLQLVRQSQVVMDSRFRSVSRYAPSTVKRLLRGYAVVLQMSSRAADTREFRRCEGYRRQYVGQDDERVEHNERGDVDEKVSADGI